MLTAAGGGGPINEYSYDADGGKCGKTACCKITGRFTA